MLKNAQRWPRHWQRNGESASRTCAECCPRQRLRQRAVAGGRGDFRGLTVLSGKHGARRNAHAMPEQMMRRQRGYQGIPCRDPPNGQEPLTGRRRGPQRGVALVRRVLGLAGLDRGRRGACRRTGRVLAARPCRCQSLRPASPHLLPDRRRGIRRSAGRKPILHLHGFSPDTASRGMTAHRCRSASCAVCRTRTISSQSPRSRK